MGLVKYKLPELVAHYLQKWRNSSETCKIYINENNSQHKNSKKENKKKRNQGKAKSEEKPFFLVYRRSELQGYHNIYHNESQSKVTALMFCC